MEAFNKYIESFPVGTKRTLVHLSYADRIVRFLRMDQINMIRTFATWLKKVGFNCLRDVLVVKISEEKQVSA